MKKFMLLSLFVFGIFQAEAQVKVVQPSPKSKVMQVIGLDSIKIEYSRPSMRGREIFGGLVPFDKVWRTGANENTTIEFFNTFNFAGVSVKPGKYALYTVPKTTKWEVILYDKADNWGTPKAIEENHVVARCVVEPKRIEPSVETFLISFSNLTDSSAILSLVWENTILEIPITVNTTDAVMQSIKETMGQNPKFNDYTRAANFYIKNNQNKDLALKWAQKAVDLEPTSFSALMTLSKAYAYLSDYTRAIEYAKQSKEIAEKLDYQNYVKQNEENIQRWSQEM